MHSHNLEPLPCRICGDLTSLGTCPDCARDEVEDAAVDAYRDSMNYL